jgi:hypothetical protein
MNTDAFYCNSTGRLLLVTSRPLAFEEKQNSEVDPRVRCYGGDCAGMVRGSGGGLSTNFWNIETTYKDPSLKMVC